MEAPGCLKNERGANTDTALADKIESIKVLKIT